MILPAYWLTDMKIVPEFAHQAMEEGLKIYPRFGAYGPQLIARPVFRGHALMLQYAEQPPKDDPDVWEFQNAVVKTYKKLAGV